MQIQIQPIRPILYSGNDIPTPPKKLDANEIRTNTSRAQPQSAQINNQTNSQCRTDTVNDIPTKKIGCK